jgi:hypothetical protein
VATSTTMKALETDYRNALEQVDVTGVSLNSLVDPNQPDPKKAFEKYSKNVGKMVGLGKRLSGHAEKMQAQQKSYFEEWRMQGNAYANPQIQALSEQRRADLSDHFARIAQASVGVNGAIKSYLSGIGQIKTYLSNDLTPKGIDSLNDTVQQAVADGESLKEAVEPVLSAIESAREEMAQGRRN